MRQQCFDKHQIFYFNIAVEVQYVCTYIYVLERIVINVFLLKLIQDIPLIFVIIIVYLSNV